MAIEIIRSISATGTATTYSLALGTDIQDGDVAFLVYSVDYSLGNNTPDPSGWTRRGSYDIGDGWSLLWSKTLSAADANTTVTAGSTTNRKGLSLVVVRGAEEGALTVWNSASASVNSTIPGVSGSAEAQQIALFATEDKSNPGLASGWSLLTETLSGTYDSNRTEIHKKNTLGTTGDITISGNNAGGATVWSVAFEPVAVAVNDSFDADTPTTTFDSIEPEVVIATPARMDVDTSILTAESHEAVVETSANIDLTLDTAAINLDAVDDEASGGTSVIVSTATMSTDSHDPEVGVQVIHIAELSPTADFGVRKNGIVEYATSEQLVTGGSNLSQGFYLFDLPENFAPEGLISAEFRITMGNTSGSLEYLAQISELDTANYRNSTISSEQEIFPSTNTPLWVDITNTFDANTFKGFMVRAYAELSTPSTWFYTSESTNEAYRPVLRLTYAEVPVMDVETPNVGVGAVEAEVMTGTNVGLDVETQTVSVKAVEPSVSIETSFGADTATLSWASDEPVVEAFINPNSVNDVATASVTMEGSASASYSLPTTVDADDTDTVMFGAYDVEISTTIGEVVQVNTPEILVTHHQVTDVNGEPVLPSETEDPYFESTWRTLAGIRPGIGGTFENLANDAPLGEYWSEWFRFNERSGTEAYDRAYATNPDGTKLGQDVLTLSNVVIGLNNGPDGRHNVHFNGDAYAELAMEHDSLDYYVRPSGIEFTIRTERKTQFLMGGSGISYPTLYSTRTPTWELWLVDGRLETREYDGANVVASKVVRGFKDIADGKWHHVVIQQSHEGSVNQYRTTNFFSVEFYVDARLDVRRRTGTRPMGFPDHIGGRAGLYYDRLRRAYDISKAHWFKGDLTELVYRNGRVLNDDEIAIQRDNVMGIRAVHVDSADTEFQASESMAAKGNRPRLLILDFGTTRNGLSEGIFPMGSQVFSTAEKLRYYNPTAATGGKLIHEATFPGYGDDEQVGRPSTPSGDFLWFKFGIGGYRDEITDNRRLIDLENDINMDDYDVISIIGYPRNDSDWGILQWMDAVNAEPKVPVKVQVEHLLNQIRSQVVHNGKGLYITDPFSAIDLGIIDKAEYVPNFVETAHLDNRIGAVTGMMNMHAARIDPFYGANPDTPLEKRRGIDTNYNTWEQAASRYDDLDANIKQRVVNEIRGLTDQPGWIHTHAIRWFNLNPFATMPWTESRAYEDRSAGLRIGDEFYMESSILDPNYSGGHFDNILRKLTGWVAAPISAIKVGKPVTAFSKVFYSTMTDEWMHENFDADAPWTEIIDYPVGNPYYNHAVSIVVEQGDMWGDEAVSGKVYVNFTEADVQNPEHQKVRNIMQMATRFPDALDKYTIGVGDRIEFADGGGFTVQPWHIKYQFSTFYGSGTGSQVRLPDTGGSGPDWGWSPGGTRGASGGGGTGGAYALNYYWSPSVPYEKIPNPTMSNRALKWLITNLDIGGDSTVYVDTPEVSTNGVEAEVESYANTEVNLSTARVNVEAHTDLDTFDPDTTILVTTPTATVQVTGLVSETFVETATVSLRTSDSEAAEVAIDWSEALVMTLPISIETLILEEA